MADSDQSLKILIELGILGEADAKAAAQLIDEVGKATGDLSQSLPEGSAQWSKYKNVLNQGNTEAEGFNYRGREMKKVLNELNSICPGTSTAVDGVMKSISGAAVGGGFAAVLLAIEAIKVYWDLYKDSVAQAAEAQAKALEKIRNATRDARVEMEDFATAKEKAMRPDDEEAAKLANDQAVVSAQFRGKREILKAEQEAAMANAQTPEQKAAVEQRFKGKATELDANEQNAKLGLLNGTIEKLTEKIAGLETSKTDLVEERGGILAAIKTANRLGLSTDSESAKLANVNARIKTIDDQIIESTQKKTRYSGQASTDQAVFNIDQFTRSAVEQPVVSRAVMEGGLSAKAGDVSAEQRAANLELTKLFGQYHGGIQTMVAVLKAQQQIGATQAAEIQALKNALNTLQSQVQHTTP